MKKSQQLFRHQGAESRSIQLDLVEDGGLFIEAQDVDGAAGGLFAGRDRASSVAVPPQAVAHLAFALLAERFGGQPNAVDALRGFCRKEGITHQFTGARQP